MKNFNCNIEQALAAQKDSPLGYNSEFRKAEALDPLLGLHPNWNRLKKTLNNGSEWPVHEIDKDERSNDVQEALTFGNHKGATTKPELLKALVNGNVSQGFATPFPINKINRLNGVLIIPLNIQSKHN
jgi:hypothetical protein